MLGVVISNLQSSQIAYYTINEINKYKHDKVIFFEQLASPCLPINCGTLCINEICNFEGTLITTNIKNTIMCSENMNRKKIKHIFYVWDLEWLRQGKKNFLANLKAYMCPDVLIARHGDHFYPIYNYCNRKPLVIKDFKLNEITK